MSHMSVFGILLLTISGTPAVGTQLRKVGAMSAMVMRESNCYHQRTLALEQKLSNPGAGMDPKAIEPFVEVSKDGFYMVDCIKDEMFYNGDKFGDHKAAYELRHSSNVSIVHYDAHVPREDRKEMSQGVCFNFCRTVPDMLYFGLQNGRGCYCAPYYKMAAGDSSACDAVCPGDASTMCGGKSKSSIFEMHSCDDMAKVFSDTAAKTGESASDLKQFAEKAQTAAADMTSAADGFQKRFGNAGDPVAAGLMQSAKVFAGEMQHEAEAAEALASANEKVSAEKVDDFKSFKGVDKADTLIEKMEAGLKEMKTSHEALNKTYAMTTPYDDSETTAGEQYYPVMYLVDKAHEDAPSTCGGTSVGEPIFDQSFDECGKACDANVHDCVGFSFFKGEHNLCFLLSKFSTATYYTGCGQQGQFLQREEPQKEEHTHGDKTMCFAKFSKFEGTTLKPNPSGKCEQCFTKVTGADRCFE